MTDDEQALYIKPAIPIKDVAKRLPPTRTPSFNSQLVAIKESPKEAVITPPPLKKFQIDRSFLDYNFD